MLSVSLQMIILIIFLFFAYVHCYLSYKKFDGAVFLIIGYMIFYGLYPLVDLFNGSYTVKDKTFFNVYLYVIFSLLFFLFFVRILRKRFAKFRFIYLITRIREVEIGYLHLCMFISVGVIFYFYARYHLIFRAIIEDKAIINQYSKFVINIVIPLFYLIFIASYVKLSSSNVARGKIQRFLLTLYYWLIGAYFLFYGRREFILLVLIFLLIRGMSGQLNNIFHPRKIPALIAAGLVIIMASNFYQNVRNELNNFATSGERVMISWEMFFDFDASSSNLEARPSLLRLLSIVMGGDEYGRHSHGALFSSNFQIAVPSFLYPNKSVVNEDYIISDTYGLDSTDYSASTAILFYADFGFWAYFLYPLFLLVYWLFVERVIKINDGDSLIVSITIVLFLVNLYNIEGGVTAYFVSMRNILMFVVGIKLIRFCKRIRMT